MTISNKLYISRRLVEKWEQVITIFWLIYFMGVRFPPPIPESLVNALSYPFIAFLIVLHWKRLSWVATKDSILLLLVGYSFASFFWSVAPALTLNANRGLLRTVLFGAYLATRYSIREQIKILAWVFGIGGILSVMAALGMPSYGISDNPAHNGAFTGVFPYKNYLGYFMVLGVITFLITFFKERKSNLLFWSGFCIIVVLLSRSSAGLVCLLFLLSLMPLYQLNKLKYRQRMILICFVLILIGTIATIVLINLETILVDILGESAEFSGRTPLWTLIIEKVVEERPWFGYGMNAFWKSNAGSYVIANTWASNSQENVLQQSFNFHNGYLPVFSSLGFVGLTLYLLSLVKTFIRVFVLFVATKKIEFFWMLQFLSFIVMGGLADDIVSILGSSSYCVIYISICLSTIVEYRKLRYTQENRINA
jgi:exopolysaccharide production protein ExoQ